MWLHKWQKIQRWYKIDYKSLKKWVESYIISNKLNSQNDAAIKIWTTRQTLNRIQKKGFRVEMETIQKLLNAGIEVQILTK
jgi:hypothetical protein